jgi:hypothetical protein
MCKARLGSSRSLALVMVLTLTLLIALSIPTPVSAATLRVRPSGGPGYFTTIQAAVNAANANDVILVYPGTYGPVELSAMATPGNISVIAVDSSGNPTPGTVTVNGGGSSAFAWSLLPHLGGVTIDGFVVTSPMSYGVYIPSAQGDVVVRNVTADGTGKTGIYVSIAAPSNADVTVEGCRANSGFGGIAAHAFGGDALVENSTANGTATTGISAGSYGANVTVRNCTANNNSGPGSGYGIMIPSMNAKPVVGNCTANNNALIGISVASDTASITGCIARGNGQFGIAHSPIRLTSTWVNGNIICDNSSAGLFVQDPATGGIVADAEGNWWGCSGGPGSPGCDTVQGSGVTIDFTPWISAYTADATPGSGVTGQPVQISFQFSDSGGTMFLPKGPGDLNGSPTFTLHTDNGTLTDSDETGATVHEFIGSGDVLSVTLVPDAAGTATVTVDGPCELAAAITIDVSQAEEFVPEPGSVILLASGLMGLAGYASLRWRSKD